MSLVLEALNRSTRDRAADSATGGVPGLDTHAFVDDSAERSRWFTYAPWLGLIAALVFIGVLVADKYRVEEAVPSVSPPAQVPQDVRVPVKDVSVPVTARPTSEPGNMPAVVPGRSIEFVPAPSAKQAAPDAAVIALYGKPRSSAARQEPRKSNSAAVKSDEPIDIAKVLARTEEALKTSRLESHPAPFIADLSQQKKDAIPSILYRHHDYSNNPGQSSVILNGKTVRVGGSVTNGIKLDEILPDSIVLNQRGEQFRLRALNSWVNL